MIARESLLPYQTSPKSIIAADAFYKVTVVTAERQIDCRQIDCRLLIVAS